MSRTAVVILNWNTRDYLERFIPPVLESISGMDADLVVADSGSTDGSLEFMRENHPSVKLIPLGGNFGFTGGYNRAFKLLDAFPKYDYFVLLNSDIEVDGGWLAPLVGYMDSHPECGACAPKLHSLLDRDSFEYAGAAGGCLDNMGYPYCRGRVLGKLEKDLGQYDSDEGTPVLWATGAALLVRTSLWEALGGLDDRFFAHMEEIDLCWRMQLEGHRVVVISDSLVYHLGGGTLPKSSPQKLMLNYRNNILLLQNNLPGTYALEYLRKGLSFEKAAAKGRRKAGRRILMRKIMDGGSAAVYLCLGRISSVKAVYTAHKEASRIGNMPDITSIVDRLQKHPDSRVYGIGKNVFFEYLKK